MAGHASAQTTKLYNRSKHQVSAEEMEKRLGQREVGP